MFSKKGDEQSAKGEVNWDLILKNRFGRSEEKEWIFQINKKEELKKLIKYYRTVFKGFGNFRLIHGTISKNPRNPRPIDYSIKCEFPKFKETKMNFKDVPLLTRDLYAKCHYFGTIRTLKGFKNTMNPWTRICCLVELAWGTFFCFDFFFHFYLTFFFGL